MKTRSFVASVIEIVLSAGIPLKDNFGRNVPLTFKSSGSGAADVVTTFDTDAERFITEKLKSLDPSIGCSGEEFGRTGNLRRYWLIDPIDGTGNYIRGIPKCTTMLALVEDGIVTLSFIYNFVTGELYMAERGTGATLNQKPIRVSNRSMRDAYISAETNLRSQRSRDAYTAIRNQYVVIHTITCGYEFGLVAQGKLDGRISFDPFGKAYDFAPGSLLVQEAGGRVTNIGLDTYDVNNLNIIAANIPVHQELSAPDSALASYI